MTIGKNLKKPKKTKVKLPSFWTLAAQTWRELTTFWKPLTGVVAVYGVLYFTLVMGFSLAYTYQDIADSISTGAGNVGWMAKKSLTVVSLFVSSNQSDAGAIVQFILFVISTLAFIWALRKLRTLKHIRMRDAYFEGTARIVPTVLVLVLLFITFIPASVGSAIVSVLQSGSGIELVIAALIAAVLFFATIYWLCAWLPAIYVVSLPKGSPITAIRASAKLTKKHRFWMVRNLLLFVFLTIVIDFTVMLLFVWIVPAASVVAAYIVSFITFGIAQTYLFIMYRGLLDES
jgi:hypothetical protein